MSSDALLPIYSVEEASGSILKRHAFNAVDVPAQMLDSLESLFGERISPAEAVHRIIDSVQTHGDEALRDWNLRLDGVRSDDLKVSKQKIADAIEAIPDDLRKAMTTAADRIRDFHSRQPITSWINPTNEGVLGQIIRPVDSVGIYVPGGQTPLFSSLLMSVIPAQAAGVEQIVICSPPQKQTGTVADVTLAAAAICGVDTIYLAGGAQAIAAMAYGTETIPRVAKVVGAGGLFTTLAKQQVYGDVGIDGLPGPTETMVIADGSANPALVAADLLAQAEHVLASSILVTPSRQLADRVAVEIARQIESLSWSDNIAESMQKRGGAVIVEDLPQAFDIANTYAAEHLCLLVENPWSWLGSIRNAGGVFLGENSFEVLGDYVAGPSHIMPTGGTARFASPVNVLDFVKITSVIGLNDDSASELSSIATALAQAEALTAHAAAASARIQSNNKG